jgi:hypothetical protein
VSDGLREAVVEQVAVRQVGERVVPGEVFDFFLRRLVFGDVGKNADIASDLAPRVTRRADA